MQVSQVTHIVKNLPANAGDTFHLWVRKISWNRKWQHTPVFLPGNSMDRRACRTAVHGVAKRQTQVGTQAFYGGSAINYVYRKHHLYYRILVENSIHNFAFIVCCISWVTILTTDNMNCKLFTEELN